MKKLFYVSFTLVIISAITFVLYNMEANQMILQPQSRNIPTYEVGNVDASSISLPVENSSHYLIHTTGCTIVDIDPDHPSIVKYKGKPMKLVCSEKKIITEDIGLNLIFYEDRIPDYFVSENAYDCYYQGILRVEQKPGKYNGKCDKDWKIKEKIPIKQKLTHIDEDAILVTCEDMNKNSTAFYHNVHFFIQPRRIEAKRKIFKEVNGQRRSEQLSIIFFGNDAVSRGNLRRHMPKTFDFLKNNLHVIDLQGFNKVGDNTDPNVAAYLMGLSDGELEAHQCTKKAKTRYDECPLIWHDFADKGYATIYAEDAPWMGTFHFNKHGFCKQPTDYYNRAYFYASTKAIAHTGGHGGYNGKLCQGPRSSISLIHEFSLKIAEELKDIPYFGYYWAASISHDYLNSAAMADEPNLNYLKSLRDGGYLNHTVLFFVSDHGLRWGSFRSTYAGMLEERLPYITMAFPNWFKQKYSDVMKNLHINTRRLTASFDVHATLHDILNEAFTNNVKRSEPMSRGLSFFTEIPENRTCKEAGVPEHYCACEHTKAIDTNDPHVIEAARVAVEDINKSLQNHPLCAQLTLDKVVSSRIGYPNNATMPKEKDSITSSYLVTFITKPGAAMMESTIKYQNGIYMTAGEISRVNQYGNQSHCINDFILRKYCYCKDLI